MKKSVIVFKAVSALVLSLVFLVQNVSVNADGFKPGAQNGDKSVYISPEEQINKILNNPLFSKEKKQAAYEKYLIGNEIVSGKFYRDRSANSSNIMNVPWCPQTEGYYCGPASVQQVLTYLNGYSPSQDDLAKELNTTRYNGTDTGRIVDYLNSQISKTYEARWSWKDKYVLEHMVVYATDVNDLPIIAHIIVPEHDTAGNPLPVYSWPFYTDGHYVVYNGYSNGGSTIHVTDPYAHMANYNQYRIRDGKYTVESWEGEKVTDRLIW